MTLEQLRVFVAVAERQHMTRAAEALHLAQSAVSAGIAALEGRHGAKLFSRVGRGIELTEAGRVFLDEARAVLARAEAAELKLAELAGLKRGRLLIHASQTIASYWLPRHLVDFRRAHPGIAIKLTVGNTAEASAAVLAGTAELGFVEGRVEEASLESREVARDSLILLVPPDHAWAQGAAPDQARLSAAEWVMREPGSGTRQVLEDALSELGVRVPELRVALELPTNEAVRAAVESGMGVTALSASAAAASLEAGLLATVPLALPERAFNLLIHRERHASNAAKALMEQVDKLG